MVGTKAMRLPCACACRRQSRASARVRATTSPLRFGKLDPSGGDGGPFQATPADFRRRLLGLFRRWINRAEPRGLYRSLTAKADLPPMRQRLVNYLRFLGFSLSALAVAACARIAPAHELAFQPEPLTLDAPPEGSFPWAYDGHWEDMEVAALQARLDAVEAEITNLSKALEHLGPLPPHPELFIPVALSEIHGAAPAIAQRYSATPRGGYADVLFHTVELGALPRPIIVPDDMPGLAPGYAGLDASIRLAAAFRDDEVVNALCIELSALAGPCQGIAALRGW